MPGFFLSQDDSMPSESARGAQAQLAAGLNLIEHGIVLIPGVQDLNPDDRVQAAALTRAQIHHAKATNATKIGSGGIERVEIAAALIDQSTLSEEAARVQ